jgi:hypothetical protein
LGIGKWEAGNKEDIFWWHSPWSKGMDEVRLTARVKKAG